jgi:hypothetical protein
LRVDARRTRPATSASLEGAADEREKEMEGDRGSKMGGGGARAQAAPAFMQLKFLEKGEKKRLDAARAVWPVRFGTELPEVMTAAECDQALRIGSEILYPDARPMRFSGSPPPCGSSAMTFWSSKFLSARGISLLS